DGIMIGRGCIGNPWLIRDLVDYFNNQPLKSPPTKEERIEMMLYHYEELLKIKPEKIATIEMRSLASHYTKGISSSKDFKIGLINCTTKEAFYENVKSNLLNM
ncbi:MAG: tRNA-dihydrouridine synthase, partial [Bacilli bacterium]